MHVLPLGISLEGYDPGRRVARALHRRVPGAGGARKGTTRPGGGYLQCGARPASAAPSLEAAGYLAPEHRGYLRGIERR